MHIFQCYYICRIKTATLLRFGQDGAVAVFSVRGWRGLSGRPGSKSKLKAESDLTKTSFAYVPRKSVRNAQEAKAR
jgi:hypothetical protein